jgi:hypothetical protein
VLVAIGQPKRKLLMKQGKWIGHWLGMGVFARYVMRARVI